MIPVCCITNLDEYKHEKWPTKMVVRPIEGDRVRSEGGSVLRVFNVTHAIGNNWTGEIEAGQPYLIVELNKRR